KIRIGNKLYFGDSEDLVAEVIDNTTSRGRTLRFLYDGPYDAFREKLHEMGQTPLPKYIKREEEDFDRERYQTIYAKHEGAVAAPTAGLHFSKHVLKRLEIKGVDMADITLHVGLGTFNPVEVEDLSKHKMDSEELIIDQQAVDMVNNAKANKKRVCSIGTTSMRALESAVSSSKTLNTFRGWTHKFIFPPHEFSIADSMITNLHLPKSTLLMMVSAFAGHEFIKKAYQEAVKKKYRFYSYGDAMLIL
ncbi:MAG: tRNA preQ1(34) S-adenosylmethionine ribosyltransferase-isomerase QueA, partial [Flavobacteriaceae bacterium]